VVKALADSKKSRRLPMYVSYLLLVRCLKAW